MEEKFDQILHNQTKMLEHLTVLTKDVNELKVGQKRLEKDQEELKQGQEKLIERVTSLEEGQEELIERVTSLEEGQKELIKGQAELKKEQQLSNEEINWLHEDYFVTRKKVKKIEEKLHLQTV